MKHPLLILILLSASLVPSARAAGLPHFETLRVQVLSQLDLATNGVPEPDKKLVSALGKALATIDKTKSNYAAGARSLGVIAKGLNRTGPTISNAFVAVFQSTVGDYVAGLLIDANTLSNRLVSTFPSKARTVAEDKLANLDASLDSALAAGDVAAATRFLSTAAKNLSSAAKNADKAEDAPPPPSHLTATITGSGEGTVNFSPSPAPAVASRIVDLLDIVAVNVRVSGTTTTTRNLSINIPSLVNGTTTYNVADSGSGNANIIYTTSTGGIGGPPSGDAFSATSGSLTVTVNTTTKTAFGSFNFSAPGQNNPGNVATSSNGSFAVTYQ